MFVLNEQEIEVVRDDRGRLYVNVDGTRVAGPGRMFGSRLSGSFQDMAGRVSRFELRNRFWSDVCAMQVDGRYSARADLVADRTSVGVCFLAGLICVINSQPLQTGQGVSHLVFDHARFVFGCLAIVWSATVAWSHRHQFEVARTVLADARDLP
jgi:hypothetical protein